VNTCLARSPKDRLGYRDNQVFSSKKWNEIPVAHAVFSETESRTLHNSKLNPCQYRYVSGLFGLLFELSRVNAGLKVNQGAV
jgi:hypothetical protein